MSIETDFVVIGSGGAGLAAALVAACEGLRVTVIEKTDVIGGTTAISGGTLWVPNNHLESQAGVDDSEAEALEYLTAAVGHAADPEHIELLAKGGREAVQYLEERGGVHMMPMPAGGGSMDYRPWLPGAKIGGRGITSVQTFLDELGEYKTKLRLADTSEWTFDARDYISKRMHLDPPGHEHPGASMYSPPTTGDDRPVPASVGRGAALIAQLLRGCLANGVEILTDTRATSLVVDGDRITGVRVERDGAEIEISASAGVMVATGGYSNEETLRRLWLSRTIVYSCEIDENTGDGHLMGMAAGAQLAGIGDAWWSPHIPLGTENAVVNTAGSREDRSLPHTIIVNGKGRRFMNEAVNYHDAGEAFPSLVGGWPSDFPAWLVFDQQGAEKYAILSWKVAAEGAEPEEWRRSAATLRELAEAIEVDADGLLATVERFNRFAQTGVDDDFGRGESAWDQAWGDYRNEPNPSLGPLERGPFHAIRVYPGSISSRGGLRVDAQGRVFSAATGAPFRGLYAAGNASSGGPTSAYPGPGATLGAAVTFAYAAARHAADAHFASDN